MAVSYTPSSVGQVNVLVEGKDKARPLLQTVLQVYPSLPVVSRPSSALQGPTFASTVQPMAAPWRDTPTPGLQDDDEPPLAPPQTLISRHRKEILQGREFKKKAFRNADDITRHYTQMRHDRAPTKPKTELERFKLSVAFGQTIRSPVKGAAAGSPAAQSKALSANETQNARSESHSRDPLVADKAALSTPKRTPRAQLGSSRAAAKLEPISRSPAHRSPYKSLRLPANQTGDSKTTTAVLSSAGKHKARVASTKAAAPGTR